MTQILLVLFLDDVLNNSGDRAQREKRTSQKICIQLADQFGDATMTRVTTL